MKTIKEKIEFLKTVNADDLSDRIREPFMELKDVTNDFQDDDLLEGMIEIVEELITAITGEAVVKHDKSLPPSEITPAKEVEETEEVPSELVEEVVVTETTDDEPKVVVVGEKAPKTRPKIKVINHSAECIALKDDFLAVLREIINDTCSTSAYPYACSMSQTEQGFLQLATQVFDICIKEKDMSIKSALNILESETNVK